ncbi:MAG: hypothetical protein JSR17_00500 [Proteobacteria bacterium]|nr:hypothetical protein [Pseudomonadota bacterium]
MPGPKQPIGDHRKKGITPFEELKQAKTLSLDAQKEAQELKEHIIKVNNEIKIILDARMLDFTTEDYSVLKKRSGVEDREFAMKKIYEHINEKYLSEKGEKFGKEIIDVDKIEKEIYPLLKDDKEKEKFLKGIEKDSSSIFSALPLKSPSKSKHQEMKDQIKDTDRKWFLKRAMSYKP